jgi:hypothetical protein
MEIVSIDILERYTFCAVIQRLVEVVCFIHKVRMMKVAGIVSLTKLLELDF